MTDSAAPRQGWVIDALQRYEAPLLRYASRLVGDAEIARDLTQESFLRLCRQPRPKVDGHLRNWLYTVCRNAAFDHLRKAGRMDLIDATDLSERTDDVTPPPTARAERKEAEGMLRRGIDALPARQREVVHLKFAEGLSYREIARLTGESVGNVGYMIHAAIKSLRVSLGVPVSPASGARSES